MKNMRRRLFAFVISRKGAGGNQKWVFAPKFSFDLVINQGFGFRHSELPACIPAVPTRVFRVMRVVHLSTSDVGGGAARAAYRLHTGLTRLGVDSRMIVLKRQSGNATVTKLEFSQNISRRIKRSWRARCIRNDFEPYKTQLPKGFEIFSDDRSDAGYDLIEQIPECDIINLHWVAGLIDHEVFFSNVPAGVPLVWRLADMGALTGGCHYDNGCGKFTAICGACPVLGSKVEEDLSRQVWKRKHEALSKIETSRMHLVGTSRWIAAEAKRSSLLGRFESTIIPNGLDTQDFSPRDKGFRGKPWVCHRMRRWFCLWPSRRATSGRGLNFYPQALIA